MGECLSAGRLSSKDQTATESPAADAGSRKRRLNKQSSSTNEDQNPIHAAPQTAVHRSVSADAGAESGKLRKNPEVLRSSSTRPISTLDPVIKPHEFVNQDSAKVEGLETKHFVLVHGGGFGAWCWYKTMALLSEDGYEVTAVDLTASGIHLLDANTITSLSQYANPLIHLVKELNQGQKVILVGHDLGGTCISYAMELFPSKVSKAVFIAAPMLTNGQNTLDIFFNKDESDHDLMKRTHIFLYANGSDKPPTAIDFNKSHLNDLLFNKSPVKDFTLASVSMRPIPFSPIVETLSLTEANYGSVRRFYIETLDDRAMSVTTQESMISKSPPEQVFRLKGADHSPFFSKPQTLHKLLVEISKIP